MRRRRGPARGPTRPSDGGSMMARLRAPTGRGAAPENAKGKLPWFISAGWGQFILSTYALYNLNACGIYLYRPVRLSKYEMTLIVRAQVCSSVLEKREWHDG